MKIEEHHDELDILDSLGLAEESTAIRLKHVLLDTSDVANSTKQLTTYVQNRLDEGYGEMLFDLGFEDNGDTMGFSKENWDFALKRLEDVTDKIKADCRVLMTRNVGTAEEEVGPRDAKDTSCSGKVMVRRRPQTVDDVIETRIAVVGNGMHYKRSLLRDYAHSQQSTPERAPCSESS
jgi:GTPase